MAVLGLIVGGVAAAPFAGYVVKRLDEAVLLRAVGILICGLAVMQMVQLMR